MSKASAPNQGKGPRESRFVFIKRLHLELLPPVVLQQLTAPVPARQGIDSNHLDGGPSKPVRLGARSVPLRSGSEATVRQGTFRCASACAFVAARDQPRSGCNAFEFDKRLRLCDIRKAIFTKKTQHTTSPTCCHKEIDCPSTT